MGIEPIVQSALPMSTPRKLEIRAHKPHIVNAVYFGLDFLCGLTLGPTFSVIRSTHN